MKPGIQLRELTYAEREEIELLANSRTTEARLVERARIILAGSQGRRTSAIARAGRLAAHRLHLGRPLQAQGTAALPDQPRSGRPATYPPEQVAEVIAASMTDPTSLGL